MGSWADDVNIILGTAAGTPDWDREEPEAWILWQVPDFATVNGPCDCRFLVHGNEQTMLNAVYAAVRALGLGS